MKWLFSLCVALGLVAPQLGATGRLVFSENFDAATAVPSALGSGTQGGGTLQVVADAAHVYGGTGKSLRGTYPAQTGNGSWGGTPVWASINLTTHQTDHFYLRFRAKIPGYKYGSKFLKIFSLNEGTRGYANTTFGLNNDASLYLIYGDGTYTENDAANKINFDGSYPQWTGRSYGLPGHSLATPQGRDWTAADWGDGWHLFEIYMKFNSGTSAANEVNNGEYLLRIDGNTYVDAKGLFNRHHSNQSIESISLFGWAQGDGPMPGFEIWLDDIQVSLDGWADNSSTDPYTQWKNARFGASASQPSLAGDDRDPDGDGLTNLVEYALGGDPLVSEPALVPTYGLALRLSFTRLAPAAVHYLIEGSTDLQTWTPLATLPAGATTWTSTQIIVQEPPTGPTRLVRAYCDVTAGNTSLRFLRLRITVP